MAIDTLSNVKIALAVTGTGDDTLLTQLMGAAESFVTAYCGTAFGGGPYTEVHPGGGSLLFLKNFPVNAVTTIKVDASRTFGPETVRPATEYILHANRGVVESLTGPFLAPRFGYKPTDWPGAVQVMYSVPAADPPAAVRQAFAHLVGHWYSLAKTADDAGHLLLTQLVVGGDLKSWSWGMTTGMRVPPGVLQMLNLFRVPAA